MSAEHERQLLARARELADVGEPAEAITGILGGGRRAGLDPAALGGLVGAAAALGVDGLTVYAAGRGPGARYANEGEFAGELADAEDDIAERLKAARKLHDQTVTTFDAALDDLDAGRQALAAALSMPTKDKCDGCHGAKAAAILAAETAIAAADQRIAICQSALEILAELTARLRHALARIRAVPSDLGETYESVYTLIRRGGVMPHQGRWVTGQQTPGT